MSAPPAVQGHAIKRHGPADWRCSCGAGLSGGPLGNGRRGARDVMRFHRADLWMQAPAAQAALAATLAGTITEGARAVSEIVPFAYNGQQVRALLIGGAPWWIARDLCDVLGIQNASDSVRKLLDEDEVSQVTPTVASSYSGPPPRPQLAVSESGLYALILGSRKPEARKFRRWVTREVLPALRQHGTYTVPGGDAAIVAAPEAKPSVLAVAQYEERAYRQRSRQLDLRGLYENRRTGEIALLPGAPSPAATGETVNAFRDRLSIASLGEDDVISLMAWVNQVNAAARTARQPPAAIPAAVA